MSQWVDRIQNHAVHQQLQVFKETLNEIEKDSTATPSPEVTDHVERLKQVGNLVEKVLSTLDPFLAPLGILDSIN